MNNNKLEFNKDCSNYPYLPTIIKAKRRIIVIGDVHGDYDLVIKSFNLAKLIDKDLNWVGKDTVVVQVGDQIDRCRPGKYKCDDPRSLDNDKSEDIKIIKFFNTMHKKALVCGGAVYSLLGNHELMNIMGNINYVSYQGLKSFENNTFLSGKDARRHAFSPGNKYAKLLGCSRVSALIIGSFLFVHGGIIPEFTKKLGIQNKSDLYKINYNVRKWILGLINKHYVADIVNSTDYSMFWNRILGAIPPGVNNNNDKCVNYLDPVLKLFDIDGMIIGHTPQFINYNAGINSTCSGKLWRVDVGAANGFNKFDNEYSKFNTISNSRKAQVLEILNDKTIKPLLST